MLELLDIDQYIELKTTVDLRLIRDAANPMTRQEKQVAIILAEIVRNRDVNPEAADLNETNNTLNEGGQSEPQSSNAAGTYSAPIPHSRHHYVQPHPGYLQHILWSSHIQYRIML